MVRTWLFPAWPLPVPKRLWAVWDNDVSRAFTFEEVRATARIGQLRLNWLLNQMVRDGTLEAQVQPGAYPNVVKYRLSIKAASSRS